jgi:organic hydroperoxide reductase OsmC/OhrA
MSLVKLHRSGVRTCARGDGTLALEAPGKPRLEVATASDFRDGIDGLWGPAELLIGALATCYELTTLALAKRRELPIYAFRTDATAHIQRKDGLFRFVVIELDVEIETDHGHEQAVESAALGAKERCLVAGALDVPVRLTVEVHAAECEQAADSLRPLARGSHRANSSSPSALAAEAKTFAASRS